MTRQTHRYIARIIVEAETPLFVGSGETSLLKDALVQKDWNGLPMIQGTSLAGVLRHSFLDGIDFSSIDDDKFRLIDIWGYQFFDKTQKEVFEKYYKSINKESKLKPDGLGSRLKISSAYMLINEKQIAEELGQKIDNTVKLKYDNLPSRQHVRITDKGAAADKGLFDNEVVYKGTRFVFEIELKGIKDDQLTWDEIISKVQEPLFRLGQGSRKGYGDLKVIGLLNEQFDLTIAMQFDRYLDWSTKLNPAEIKVLKSIKSKGNIIEYKLDLTPDDFFIFSEGFGDDDVDNKPLEDEIAEYKSGTIAFEKNSVIPASSIKGAIAHRTCFHYNKLKKRWADDMNSSLKVIALYKKLWTGGANKAVHDLFGVEEGFSQDQKAKEEVHIFDASANSQRGKVILNDLYFSEDKVKNEKIFNHVAIDRFTGGAMGGALFSEKVSTLYGGLELKIFVEKYDYDDDVIHAFENALLDITKGLLPLGGMTTKGNGMFTGLISRDGAPILNYHEKEENNGTK